MTSREDHLVELVDEYGTPVGETSVRSAHEPPGRLHRAFSVFLVDDAGRVLLQRRSADKTRFPLRWANSCCGHPAPEQPLAEAANVRLHEELGVPPVPLTECGVHLYRAGDPATGRVEYEYDHVLRGVLPAGTPVRPDPAEVAEVRWVDPVTVADDLVATPDAYAPWLVGVLDRLLRPGPPDAQRHGEVAERSGGR
ncbi:isopentenyl-diphosphate Delta-isomerase [Plantactinospora sp. KBS50]|uniref:isopentenyl-diphosphate Delta-isomerase n=1 Tax=Plantactinospora sp. KBS50 TaxID=2024580 RepID=UPI000BAAF7A2|nr:isopentenyl-diphosphate Delta-isomerase [Plantactinospora sp. KBS50]ASW53090.1 isopentenyl-diphosphate delta-isomerase [Plantactinospora sp. KBS50]